MFRSPPFSAAVSGSVILTLTLGSGRAFAQATPLPESVAIGTWTFRPSLELRVRGEYRRSPVDTGGDVYSSSAVLAEGFGAALPPISDTGEAIKNQWHVAERSRIGLAVEHGAITGVFTLQDARLWGSDDAMFVGAGEPSLPETTPYEAYLEVRSRGGRRAFVRVGRQSVAWGDGRLVGANEWSLTTRSLDALRAGVELGDIDLEAIAVLLAAPGGAPPIVAGTRKPVSSGTGAQLYGIDAVWRLLPMLNVELSALARVVREPRPTWLTPGDTFVIDARAFGDHRGFRYAVEGAYELGRIATFAEDRRLGAFALAARAELMTALPGNLTLSARGAYATGDDGILSAGEAQRRFDPILPDIHDNHAPMGLYAWSNLIEAAGGVRVRPIETITVAAGYAFAGLATPGGRWVTANLLPVGAVANNQSRVLGHEIDASITFQPSEPLRLELGYGLFLFGDGAKAILDEANRTVGADVQHWAFLQATLSAP